MSRFGAAALAAIVGSAGCVAARPSPLHMDRTTAPAVPWYAPPRDPPQYTSNDGVLRARIVMERRRAEVGGRIMPTLTYNGSPTPPTLRLSLGDRMDLTMVNKVHPGTDLYLYGLRIRPAGPTGDPFLRVPAKRSVHYVVRFPRSFLPGTYWYRSFEHPYPVAQDIAEMLGAIIVQGLPPHLPPSLRNITGRVGQGRAGEDANGPFPRTH